MAWFAIHMHQLPCIPNMAWLRWTFTNYWGHWPSSLHLEEFPLLTRQPRCHEHDLMAKGIRGVAIVHHLPGDFYLRCSFDWIPSWNNWWLSSGDLATHFDNVSGLIIKSFSICILSDLEYQVAIRSITILHRFMMTSSNGTFSALLAMCAGNSPVSGEFHAQRPVTQCFDVCFDLRLNKRLSKQSWG